MKNLVFPIILVLLASCESGESIKPQKGDIVEAVYASGKVHARNEYNLFSGCNGVITGKHKVEGEVVLLGQPIFSVRNEVQEARLAAAQTALEVSRENVGVESVPIDQLKNNIANARVKFENDSTNYFRLKNLWEKNIGTKAALDNAYVLYQVSRNQFKSAEESMRLSKKELNLNLKNAQSQVTLARTDFDNFIIKSESDGVVFQTYKEMGEAVRLGELVAMVGDSSARVIRLSVDQSDIGKVKIGQQVLLRTDISGTKIFKAVVTRLYPVMKERDQSFRVDAEFLEDPNMSFLHATVEANIVIAEKKGVMLVPLNFIFGGDSLMINDGADWEAKKIKLGLKNLTQAEVVEGLSENSEIKLKGK